MENFVIYIFIISFIDIFWIDTIYTFVDTYRHAICLGGEENMFFYPIEQTPDQGNAQRTKSQKRTSLY